MKHLYLLPFFYHLSCSILIRPEPFVAQEGQHLNVSCVAEEGESVFFRLTVNGTLIQDWPTYLSSAGVYRGTSSVLGPITRSDNGLVFECNNGQVELATLQVRYSPKYSFTNPLNLMVSVPENTTTFTYQFVLDASPVPTDFNWTRNGEVLTSNARLTAAVDSITIENVVRGDSGTYVVASRNEGGMSTANFTLDVQYPPSINVDMTRKNVNFTNSFTLNCTPLSSNPPNASVVFYFNGTPINSSDPKVNGFVFTIPSIERSERGNYSCNVSNIIGSVTAEVAVNVLAPPTSPRSITFSNTQPFSSTVSWSAPEDHGGDLNPPTYRINVIWSNGSRMMYTSTDLMLQLTNLWHSLNYTVSVVAVNKYGTSPPAEMVLTTPDSVPIIASVSIKALNLSEVQVNISLLTDGGQSVMYYEVVISGRTVRHRSSDNLVSFIAGGYNFSNSEFYNATVTANNSVGLSRPFLHMFLVPNAPNITSPPTPLEPSVIATCCAGVKLNLANPNDPTLVVKVYGNGVLHPSTSREGDNLIISGLQAGREYTFRVSVRNVFGTSEENVTLTPVLGQPSKPALPNVTVDSTEVTVVLSTSYPGTEGTRNGSNFTFQLHFTRSGISTRQSNSRMQPFSPPSLTTPVNTTYSTTLDSGTYTVRVTAVNEHGSSESVMSQAFFVTEPSTQPPTPSTQTIIIGAVVGVIVFILLVLILIFICIICYKKFWRTRGHYKTESGKPVPLTNNGANGDNKDDIEMMENETALYDQVDHTEAAAKKKEAEAMGVVNQYDDPDVQQQPEMYAEVDHSAKTSNKKKKKKNEKQQETAPQPEVYAEVDKSAKTTKKGPEAQDDEPNPPPHTEGLVYAQIDFANKSSTYKKPEPKNDDVVIYSEVTVQHQPRKQDDDKEQDGNNNRDDRGGSPNAII